MTFDPFQFAGDYASSVGLDPQLALNVLQAESGGRHLNPDGSLLTSPAGAVGYMQVKPSTGADLGYDVRDPVQNIKAGVDYLKQQRDRFGSDQLGAAAYNAGPATVVRAGGVPGAAAGYVAQVIPGATATMAQAPAADDDTDFGPAAAAAPASAPAPAPARSAAQGGDDTDFGPSADDPEPVADPNAPVQALRTSGVSSTGLLVDPSSGKPFSDDVQKTWQTLAPILDAKAERGSARYPLLAPTADDVAAVQPGQYYIDATQKGAPYLKKGDSAGLNTARDGEIRLAANQRDGDTFLGDVATSATAPFNGLLAGGVAGAEQGLYNIGARAFGAPVGVTAGQRAEAAYEATKVAQASRDQADPVGSLVGQLGGGLALGAGTEGAGTAAATGLLAQAPRLAAGGGVLAGAARIAAPAFAYGAAGADGGLGQRAMSGAETAGAALGTAGLLHGAGVVGGALGQKLGLDKLVQGAGPWADRQAAGYLSRVMKESEVTPDQVRTTAAAAPLMTGAEAMGQNAVASAASLARDNGTTSALANSTLAPRAAARADRLMGEIGGITGVQPAAARGDLDGMIAAKRAAVDPQYAALRADDAPVWSPRLQQVMNTPVGRQAATDAYTSLANDPDAPPTESVGLVLDHAGNPGIADPAAAASARSGQDRTDQVLNLLRRGANVRPNSGPSLLQFVGHNGGLADDGGEVSAMDGDLWHKGKPYQRKIIQPGGLGLEAMAQKAYDAGYFPDVQAPSWESSDNMHPVGGQDLLDAMRGELAGSPRYASFDPDRADLRARMDDTQEVLDHLGIDLGRVSNADAKRAMQAHFLGQSPPDLSASKPPPADETYGPTGLTIGKAPTFTTWETVKRALDARVERDPFGRPLPDSQSLGNTNIGKAGAALRNELVRIKPAYGEALDQAGDYLGARSIHGVLKGKLFSGGFSGGDMTGALDDASPFERQAAQAAALGDIYDTARRGALTPRLLSRGDVQDKLSVLFGPDAAARMGAAADREAELIPAERFIPTLHGSPTATLLGQGADQAGGGGGHGSAFPILATDALAEMFFNPAGAAVRAGGAVLSKALQKGVQKMPVAVRNRAGAALLGSPEDMLAYVRQHTPAPRQALPPGLFGAGASALLGPRLWQSPTSGR